MKTEEAFRVMEYISRFLGEHDTANRLSVRDVSFSNDVVKRAMHDLVMLGYIQEVGRSPGHHENQFKSVTPYRAYMAGKPASAQTTEDGLGPEKPGFDPQTLPQDLSRPELERIRDWASDRLAMANRRRPLEPELKDGPAVVTFTRVIDGRPQTCAAIRTEDGLWSITGMTVVLTWDDFLDRIESESTENYDALSTLQGMDSRPQPV